uniref:VWFA domain-containing protein n=1 Tax=Prymnesium polylepis TaxID=72548 RepID=A0A7S4MHU9_9EUKA|mmetsp:Transcript_28979/g.71151  ORF Transcript_28979/g.71151 Transcript_28979/m.71151 type:complete len:207 (+) Transcript_28979:172-792(+)|eukprot:5466424-Prymnesium_polylepis.2
MEGGAGVLTRPKSEYWWDDLDHHVVGGGGGVAIPVDKQAFFDCSGAISVDRVVGKALGPNGMHIVFCLDESGSTSYGYMAPWNELVACSTTFGSPPPPVYASVVQFGSQARTPISMQPIEGATPFHSPLMPPSGTCFLPPTLMAQNLIHQHGPDSGYTAIVVFMSDGAACDAAEAAQVLGTLAKRHPGQFESHTRYRLWSWRADDS